MKINKLLKIVSLATIILSTILLIGLFIKPIKKEVQVAIYDTKIEGEYKKLGSKVEQNFYIENENTSKLTIFLGNNNEIDNWNVTITDDSGKIYFEKRYENYSSNIMIFGFDLLQNKKNYKLTIIDEDGDPIKLGITKSDKKNYLLNDKTNTLKIGISYFTNNYVFIWYYLFVITFMFTFYPFIWGDDDEKK